MKKNILMVLSVISIFCLSFGVSADEYDFYTSTTTTKKDDIEKITDAQKQEAIKYGDSLKSNQRLEYSSKVTEEVEYLTEEEIEASSEKDELVEQYESDDYTVEVSEEEHDAVETNYTFNVENKIVIGATINGTETDEFNGQNIDDVLASFSDEETEDYRIVVASEKTSENAVDNSEITITESAAKELVNSLEDRGYTVSYVANNDTISNIKITSRTELSDSDIESKLKNENTNKEVKNITVSTTAPTKGTTISYATKEEAENKKTSLDSENRYETLEVKFNYTNDATKVAEKQFVSSSTTSSASYLEDVTGEEDSTGNTKSGYRSYYTEEIQKADTFSQEYHFIGNGFEARNNCSNKSAELKNAGYTVTNDCNWSASTGFKLEATRDAIYNTYYDEYEYGKEYFVEYEDLDYIYDVNYLATDYTVSYTGTLQNYALTKSNFDKYFVINGQRTVYTITTSGNVITEAIINPYTSDNIVFYILLGICSVMGITTTSLYLSKNN
jgi:hypothetical protein